MLINISNVFLILASIICKHEHIVHYVKETPALKVIEIETTYIWVISLQSFIFLKINEEKLLKDLICQLLVSLTVKCIS